MVKESFEIIDDALLKSAIYKSLQEDKVFQQYAHKRILDLEYYDLKKLLLDLFASEAYSKYCLDYSKASELSVFVDFLKKRIPKLESLVSKLEFDYPCIEQDYDSIYVYYRKHAQDQNEWSLNTDFHMFEKSFRMSTQLIEFYFEHQTVFYSKINQKLKGWNIERIPQIEIMIVLIAIIEIYTLKDIPIKVSINEYIEISKSFTSSKGKDFINGIIHKITDEWLATGELVKIMS
jgi:N utilization substance protein B